MIDPLVENSRQVRDQLLQEFGGLQGLCDKLEEMDRTRTQTAASQIVEGRQTLRREAVEIVLVNG